MYVCMYVCVCVCVCVCVFVCVCVCVLLSLLSLLPFHRSTHSPHSDCSATINDIRYLSLSLLLAVGLLLIKKKWVSGFLTCALILERVMHRKAEQTLMRLRHKCNHVDPEALKKAVHHPVRCGV